MQGMYTWISCARDSAMSGPVCTRGHVSQTAVLPLCQPPCAGTRYVLIRCIPGTLHIVDKANRLVACCIHLLTCHLFHRVRIIPDPPNICFHTLKIDVVAFMEGISQVQPDSPQGIFCAGGTCYTVFCAVPLHIQLQWVVQGMVQLECVRNRRACSGNCAVLQHTSWVKADRRDCRSMHIQTMTQMVKLDCCKLQDAD